MKLWMRLVFALAILSVTACSNGKPSNSSLKAPYTEATNTVRQAPTTTPVALSPCPTPPATELKTLAAYLVATPNKVFAFDGVAIAKSGDLYVDQVTASSEKETTTRHLSLGVHGSSPVINSAGTQVAYLTDDGNIAVINTDASDNHVVAARLDGNTIFDYVSWSPTGAYIGYARNTKLDPNDPRHASFDRGVYLVTPDGKYTVQIVHMEFNGYNDIDTHYTWSPAGNYIAYKYLFKTPPDAYLIIKSIKDPNDKATFAFGPLYNNTTILSWFDNDRTVVLKNISPQGTVYRAVQDGITSKPTACQVATS